MTHTTEYLQKEIEINEAEKDVRIELDEINSDLNEANSERKDLVTQLDNVTNEINNINEFGIEISTEEFVRKSDLIKEELRLTKLIEEVENKLIDLYAEKKEKETKIIDFNESKKKIFEELKKQEEDANKNLIEGVVVKVSEINASFKKTPSLKPLAGSDVSGKILQTQMRTRCPGEFNISSNLKKEINELPFVKCTGLNKEKRDEYIKKLNKEKMFEELEKLIPNSNRKEVANIESYVSSNEETPQIVKEEIKEEEKEIVTPIPVAPEPKKQESPIILVNPSIGKVASSTKEKVSKIVGIYNKVSPINEVKEVVRDENGKFVNINTKNGLLKQEVKINNPIDNPSAIPYVEPQVDSNINLFSNENINSLRKVV